MPGGVDEVDQKTRTVLALFDESQVVVTQLVVQRDGTTKKEKKKVKLGAKSRAKPQRLCTFMKAIKGRIRRVELCVHIR